MLNFNRMAILINRKNKKIFGSQNHEKNKRKKNKKTQLQNAPKSYPLRNKRYGTRRAFDLLTAWDETWHHTIYIVFTSREGPQKLVKNNCSGLAALLFAA